MSNQEDYQAEMHRHSPEIIQVRRKSSYRFSLREVLGLVTITVLTFGLWNTSRQLLERERELAVMRKEFGYLAPSNAAQVAASRSPSAVPLSYRMRVRLPEGLEKPIEYQLAYSSLWEAEEVEPTWFATIPMPKGESLITIQILSDPRDEKWKISAVVSSPDGTSRAATVLPPPHEQIFRGSHDVISTGIGRETTLVSMGQSIRLLDDRWVVGDGGVILDGGAPKNTQVGVYAELQPVQFGASMFPID